MKSKSAALATPIGSRRLQNAFHAVGLAMLLAVALYFGRVVLVPLALAALFAFILSTPATWIEKRGVGRVVSVLGVTFAAFGVIAIVVAVAVSELRELAAEWPQHQPNISHKAEPVERLLRRVEKLQNNLRRTAPAATQAAADAGVTAEKPTPVVVQAPHESSLAWLPSVALPLVESLIHGVLIIVLTIFMLMQRESFRDRLIRLAGRSRLSSTTRAIEDAAARVGKYLLLQLTINASLGLVIGVGLWLLGVPYAPLWGLMVTVLRFVPYVGFWVAALGAVAIAAASSPGWTMALLTFGMFLAADLLMANVVEPLVFSHGTGVSPVALLMAAVFWAFIWGPVGLLLSTPLTVCLAVLGTHVPALGFLTTLLGDEATLDDAARFYNRLLARDYDEASVLVDAYGQNHPRDVVYDQVILPALAEAKTDREQQDITPDEEAAVYDAMEAVLDGLESQPRPVSAAASEVPPVKVIGCAVFGRADALALRMLGDAIGPAGGELAIATPERLVGDVRKAADESDKPIAVCLSTLSPGGMSQARALLGKVRRQFPSAKLLVGRWGQKGDTGQTAQYLRDSGADDIGWNLRETLRQLVPNHPKVVQASGQPA